VDHSTHVWGEEARSLINWGFVAEGTPVDVVVQNNTTPSELPPMPAYCAEVPMSVAVALVLSYASLMIAGRPFVFPYPNADAEHTVKHELHVADVSATNQNFLSLSNVVADADAK
jgi:hypothetical protein